MDYIEWNKEKLENYLSDKFRNRGINIEEYLFLIENIDSSNFVEYIRDGNPIPKEDYGKFRPKESKFLTHGYENDLLPLLLKHPNSFVFLDSVKLANRVLEELELCYKGNAKYVAIHDTCKRYKHPRRAIKYIIKRKMFKIVGEVCIEERNDIKVKGVTLLERI